MGDFFAKKLSSMWLFRPSLTFVIPAYQATLLPTSFPRRRESSAPQGIFFPLSKTTRGINIKNTVIDVAFSPLTHLRHSREGGNPVLRRILIPTAHIWFFPLIPTPPVSGPAKIENFCGDMKRGGIAPRGGGLNI